MLASTLCPVCCLQVKHSPAFLRKKCIYRDRCPSTLNGFSLMLLGVPRLRKTNEFIVTPRGRGETQCFNHSDNKIRNIEQMHHGNRCGSTSLSGMEQEVAHVRRHIETLPSSSTSLHLFLLLSVSLRLQETQGETPGSFLRWTQPEGLQHQHTGPAVQTELSAPVQPPLPQGTAPRQPPSIRFQPPR